MSKMGVTGLKLQDSKIGFISVMNRWNKLFLHADSNSEKPKVTSVIFDWVWLKMDGTFQDPKICCIARMS